MKMRRLEIHISYGCQNNCLFCSEHNRLQDYRNFKIASQDIVALLQAKRTLGFDHANFTGGEPTQYYDFEKILRSAKNLGYRIYLGSNGAFLADKKNCDKFLPLIDEISLSLHGSTAQLHELQTQTPGSFNKIMKAFSNIDDYNTKNKPLYFFCNIVVNQHNFKDIGQILKLISQFKSLKQVLLSNLAPEGSGLTNYKKLAVPLAEFRVQIGEWVKLANAQNLIIRFFGLPLCVLGNYTAYSNDLNWDERVTFELGRQKMQIKLKEKKTVLERKREKIKDCVTCLYNNLCGGVFSKYLEVFGAKEIIPIK